MLLRRFKQVCTNLFKTYFSLFLFTTLTTTSANGTVEACMSVFNSIVDNQDLSAIETLLLKCDGKIPESNLVANNQLGLLQFMECINACATYLEKMDFSESLNYIAVMESLRYVLRSKIISETITVLYSTHRPNVRLWYDAPVLLCLNVLSIFNRDKKGRKCIGLKGVLKTLQTLGNLLALDGTLIQDSTRTHMLLVLDEIALFLTKMPEDTSQTMPLCNFGHIKPKTKTKYIRIAKAFSGK